MTSVPHNSPIMGLHKREGVHSPRLRKLLGSELLDRLGVPDTADVKIACAIVTFQLEKVFRKAFPDEPKRTIARIIYNTIADPEINDKNKGQRLAIIAQRYGEGWSARNVDRMLAEEIQPVLKAAFGGRLAPPSGEEVAEILDRPTAREIDFDDAVRLGYQPTSVRAAAELLVGRKLFVWTPKYRFAQTGAGVWLYAYTSWARLQRDVPRLPEQPAESYCTVPGRDLLRDVARLTCPPVGIMVNPHPGEAADMTDVLCLHADVVRELATAHHDG